MTMRLSDTETYVRSWYTFQEVRKKEKKKGKDLKYENKKDIS